MSALLAARQYDPPSAPGAAGERVLVITPAHNEAGHLPAVAEAMVRQRRPPDLWVVVDDGSTDDTLAIARRLAARVPFMQVLEAPTAAPDETGDRLALALEARAFNFALSQVDTHGFDFIGKLDADIVLHPSHFERLLQEFHRDATLGIAGTYIEEEHGDGWRVNRMPAYHVNGAVKLYRRHCFEQIGGVRELLVWDTLDETYARMHGFRTRSFEIPRARHLRRSGQAGGFLRGRARHGQCAWLVNYPLWLVLARALRMASIRPRGVAAGAFLFGYVKAAITRPQRVDDPAVLRFSRREQRQRLLAKLPTRSARQRDGRRRATLCLPSSPGGDVELLEALAPAYATLPKLFLLPRSPWAEQLRSRGERVEHLINPRRNPLRLLMNAAQAARLVLRERPALVVTSGAGVTVPFCLLAKLLGARLLYIETMARVGEPSATGRILHRFADHFLVQWPEALDVYPKAEVCRPALLEEIPTAPARPGRGTFVATGNHSQSFERLLRIVDEAAGRGELPRPVLVQGSPGSYRPSHVELVATLPPDETRRLIAESEVIICHGGAGLVSQALRAGRTPIVLPRRRGHAEHVDDHQVQMTAKLSTLGLVASLDKLPIDAAVARAKAPPRVATGLEGPSLAVRLSELVAEATNGNFPRRGESTCGRAR